MKTDKLFYTIFLSQPSLIHELIPCIPAIRLIEAILKSKLPQLTTEEAILLG